MRNGVVGFEMGSEAARSLVDIYVYVDSGGSALSITGLNHRVSTHTQG